MATGQNSKGNPASHRMSNTVLKGRREHSWQRGQQRKTTRRALQEAAHQRNRATVAAGGLTPWQQAKAGRHARRHPAAT